MIQAYYTRRHDRLELEVSGHAGAGAKGQDIVCAGVSALTETLAIYSEGAGYRVQIEREPGKSCIRYDGLLPVALTEIFDMTFTGLELISAKYPAFVRCEIAEGQHPKEGPPSD